MENKTRAANFHLVRTQMDMPPLNESDFAWEIIRRRADYHAGPAPTRRVIGAHSEKPVILIECAQPTNRSWGLLFRKGSASLRP